MRKLTRKEKLELVREARRAYKECEERGSYIGLCNAFYRAIVRIYGEELLCSETLQVIPEFAKQRPEGVDIRCFWWPAKDRKIRFKVLDKVEQDLLPWYLKPFNQIKNLL